MREKLIPVRTQKDTAEELTAILGKPVSRQNVEMWELMALTKVLAGLQKERNEL